MGQRRGEKELGGGCFARIGIGPLACTYGAKLYAQLFSLFSI